MATTVLRPTSSGRNLSFFCQCEDSAGVLAGDYVVKLLDGKLGALLELLGSRLAAHFGIMVPEPVAVNVDAGFAALLTGDPQFNGHTPLIQSNIGLNFGSRYLNPVSQWQGGRRIPDTMVDSAVEIFAFDALIQNPDRRVTNPNLLTMGSSFYVYDHETSFSFLQAILQPPEPWIVENEPYLKQHIFHDGLKKRAIDLTAFCERLTQLTDAVLLGFRTEVPAEWMHAGLATIEGHLRAVREHPAEFEEQIKRCLR
jgi:hypothetical protein